MASRMIVPEPGGYRVRIRWHGREYDGGLWPSRLDAIAARDRLLGRLLREGANG